MDSHFCPLIIADDRSLYLIRLGGFASSINDMVTPLREHFLMFPRFGNALDILSEYCEERYEEALAAYRQASECSASEPSSYEKQAQVLEKWASKLRKRAMGLRS